MTKPTTTTTAAVDLFNEFAINETLSQDGVWVHYSGDVSFLIARAGNRNYRKVAQHLYQKHSRLLESKTDAANEKLTEIVVESMARGILLGWKGDLQFQGKPLPYSMENARTLLKLERLRDLIDGYSKDEQQFAAVQEEEDEENLPV